LLESLQSRSLKLQDELAQIEADVVKRFGVPVGEVYPLDRIQAGLPDDAALVGWLDLRTLPKAADSRGDHWACVVRRRGAPVWIRIVGTGPSGEWTQGDDEAPRKVRNLLSATAPSDSATATAALAEQRLSPIEPALQAREGLPAVKHLVVLPSASLAGIPTETLLEARPITLARYIVSYSPSGTLFAWLKERREDAKEGPLQPNGLLALGDPVPEQPVPSSRPTPGAPNQVAMREPAAALRLARGGAFVRLPGARFEVEAIAKLFKDKAVHLGSEASEQMLDSLRSRGALGQFGVIHLAAHGRMDHVVPMNSRLLFSQDKLPDPMAVTASEQPSFDGALTAGEVLSTWKLNAELVTLSACQSGLGGESVGEGFIGFAQAFLLAGAVAWF
jgi:CHAT domain-containing protein